MDASPSRPIAELPIADLVVSFGSSNCSTFDPRDLALKFERHCVVEPLLRGAVWRETIRTESGTLGERWTGAVAVGLDTSDQVIAFCRSIHAFLAGHVNDDKAPFSVEITRPNGDRLVLSSPADPLDLEELIRTIQQLVDNLPSPGTPVN